MACYLYRPFGGGGGISKKPSARATSNCWLRWAHGWARWGLCMPWWSPAWLECSWPWHISAAFARQGRTRSVRLLPWVAWVNSWGLLGYSHGFRPTVTTMLKIGLTGGIGSGKSKVADMLEEWGASIIDTDVIAHELTAPHGRAMDAIRHEFGDAVITPDYALDRAAMREIAFNNPDARRRLESILHPLIHLLARERAETAKGCYLVFVV